MAMIAWAVAARGADMGDAESARAARINLLKDENAKMMRTIEKVRGAISHWAALGFAANALHDSRCRVVISHIHVRASPGDCTAG